MATKAWSPVKLYQVHYLLLLFLVHKEQTNKPNQIMKCNDRIKSSFNSVSFAEEYFNTRLPIVMKRIVQGGVRLAMILNRVFSDTHADVAATWTEPYQAGSSKHLNRRLFIWSFSHIWIRLVGHSFLSSYLSISQLMLCGLD